MTGRLREELERIGDRAPVAQVSPDTWGRARRARTRDRVLAGAAVVAVLALVGGLVLLPSRESTPVAGGSALGVPNHLYAPPGALPLSTLTTDHPLGRTAAAWIDPLHRRAVLVGAGDGAYHAVDLPGMNEVPILDEPTVALSPDGFHLAWAWGNETTHRAGIRVVDLRTNQTATVYLSQGAGVSVLQLAFSSNSRWLGWSGAVLSTWDDSGSRSDRQAFGRLDVRTSVTNVLRSRGSVPDPSVVGIDNQGHVLVLDQGHLTTLGGPHVSRTPVGAGRVAGPPVLDDASGLLAAGVGGTGPVNQPARGTAVVVADTDTGKVRGYPSTAGHAFTTALGWVGRDVLVAVAPIKGASVEPHGGTLELAGPGHEPRVVGHFDEAVPWTLSVASDLVTPDRPTVDRPEPEWPWSGERQALTIGLGIAAALGLLVGGRWLWLRRRRHL